MISFLYTWTSALIIYISNIPRTQKYSAVMYCLPVALLFRVPLSRQCWYNNVAFGQKSTKKVFIQEYEENPIDWNSKTLSLIAYWIKWEAGTQILLHGQCPLELADAEAQHWEHFVGIGLLGIFPRGESSFRKCCIPALLSFSPFPERTTFDQNVTM